MIPNVLPCLAVFGMMSWAGIRVEIGSIMTGSVALGIAVDDTLHFLMWFRIGMSSGRSRREAVCFAYSRCGQAVIQTSVICGLGLLVFAFSPFVSIARFGWLMFTMLAAAMLADLLVLPALLISPLGRAFQPSAAVKSPFEGAITPPEE
jgi:predicted RND superfamily exporter protein